jgi:ABC-type uncharacterized transport system substrate-binding protein
MNIGMDARLGRLLLLLTLLCGGSPAACALSVALLTDRPLTSVTELEGLLEQKLKANCDVVLLSDGLGERHYDAVVLAGPAALAGWKNIKSPPHIPVVAAFVSRSELSALTFPLASAVYLEPPLDRQINLARAILGKDSPLGVLALNKASLGNIGVDVRSLSHRVDLYYLDEYESLNRALVALLRDNQALVGVYDPELYSADNIKNILITAYRQNRPLFGPSSAYIRAGSLATTYSDIEDVAARLADILTAGLHGGGWAAADYNPYFRVRYNQQVARSLNLSLPDADQIARELGSKVVP